MEEIFESLFDREMDFRNASLKSYEEGRILIETQVTKENVNPYGFAHGGYLYTLCDSTAGLIGYSLGDYIVTQQASISYIRSAALNDVLTVEGICIHNGKTTKVAEVTITNQEQRLICKATFTLFPSIKQMLNSSLFVLQ